jgi:carboxyl-terminal processing protease
MAGSTPHELRKIAQQLEGEGVKAFILDLRGPSSSSAHTALLLADSLLDHGTIGRLRTTDGDKVYQADPDALFRGWPMVVLVDQFTTGAAEWLAAAIQDNKRGIVIGSPTSNARFNPDHAFVTTLVRVGTSDWSVSLATGILERGDGRSISDNDRSLPAGTREPMRVRAVQPNHSIAQRGMMVGGSKPDAAVQKAMEQLHLLLKKS